MSPNTNSASLSLKTSSFWLPPRFSCQFAPLACECLILISSALHSGMSAKHLMLAIIGLDIFCLSGRRFFSLCCSLASNLQGLL